VLEGFPDPGLATAPAAGVDWLRCWSRLRTSERVERSCDDEAAGFGAVTPAAGLLGPALAAVEGAGADGLRC
jgi:hypothetical protein